MESKLDNFFIKRNKKLYQLCSDILALKQSYRVSSKTYIKEQQFVQDQLIKKGQKFTLNWVSLNKHSPSQNQVTWTDQAYLSHKQVMILSVLSYSLDGLYSIKHLLSTQPVSAASKVSESLKMNPYTYTLGHGCLLFPVCWNFPVHDSLLCPLVFLCSLCFLNFPFQGFSSFPLQSPRKSIWVQYN